MTALQACAGVICGVIGVTYLCYDVLEYYIDAYTDTFLPATQRRAAVYSATFIGLPTAMLYTDLVLYWLVLSRNWLTYLAIGGLLYLVYVPWRRVVGTCIACAADPARKTPLLCYWWRELWQYCREVWAPTQPYAKDGTEYWWWIGGPLAYLLLWPLILPIATHEHAGICQALATYRLPEWREYDV